MAAKRLTDLLDFLTSLGTVISDDDPEKKDKQKALLRGCLVDFKTGPPIEVQEGTNMLEEVKHAKFPQWMREEVAGAVQEKIMAGVGGGEEKKRRSCMQRNLHLYNYLTTGEWNDLSSSCTSFESKMRVIGKRFQLLGLVNPSEPTFVLANIVLQLSFCQGNPDKIDEKKHYATLKDLKLVVKNICKRTTHSGIAVYPEDPKTLGTIWEKAYSEEPPAKCAYDTTVLMDLTDGLPARCTHRSVRPGKSKGFQRDEGAQHMLANYLLANMFQGGQQEMGALCNLQFNQPNKKRALALMDRPDKPDEGDEDTPPKPPKNCDEKKSDETTPPPVSAAAKGVDQMAEEIQKQLEANKGEKKETQATKPGNQKVNPPKTTKKTGVAKAFSKAAFPGTGAAAPKHFENATIYTCPNSSSWRVKKQGTKRTEPFLGRRRNQKKFGGKSWNTWQLCEHIERAS